MPDYRRLISYIYEYEGKEKGKNVGFVKLEARNGQCRLNLSIKKVYVGGNAIGVYLLSKDGTEVFLGNIFIRGGNGEFRAVVDAGNVEGNGSGLDTYYGLTVHDVKNSWRSYTTIWEDPVLPDANNANNANNINNTNNANNTNNTNNINNDNDSNDATRLIPACEILPSSQERKEGNAGAVANVVREIEAEIAREEERKAQEELILAHAAEVGEEAGEPVSEDAPGAARGLVVNGVREGAGEPVSEDAPGAISGLTANEVSEETGTPVEATPTTGKIQEEPAAMRAPAGESVQEARAAMGAPAGESVQEAPAAMGAPAGESVQEAQAAMGAPGGEREMTEEISVRSPELENPEVLRYLQETEDMTSDPERLWQELRKSYPKIKPFDYENGCEILTIRPQDIGRLPRESWVYGNNSFLLHGYYNFRYIILFRLGSKDGRPRYLLGVPGHYYSSEKYMASMFGFPNFVLSKKQPVNDGRFGYWYTDIRVR